MYIVTMFALVDPSQFTGFEQTRAMDLITVLAFASVAIWLIILLSIVVRRIVIIYMAIVAKYRIHQKTVRRKAGMTNGS